MLPVSPRSKPGAKVAFYIRVSSKGQAKDGNGADVQEKICADIIAKYGWVLYKKYYNSKGVSGDVDPRERAEFVEMIADGAKKKFTIVVVSGLDRLARNVLNMEIAKKLIYKEKIKIFAATQFAEDTILGNMTSGFTGVLAEFEKAQLVARMAHGFEVAQFERGETKGKLHFGYKRIAKGKKAKIVINDYEANTIRMIYDKRKNGETLESIANYLNSKEIKPPRSLKWTHRKVAALLSMGKREIYSGGQRNGKNRLGICWPQILHDSYKITKEEIEMYERKYATQEQIEKEKEKEKKEEEDERRKNEEREKEIIKASNLVPLKKLPRIIEKVDTCEEKIGLEINCTEVKPSTVSRLSKLVSM